MESFCSMPLAYNFSQQITSLAGSLAALRASILSGSGKSKAIILSSSEKAARDWQASPEPKKAAVEKREIWGGVTG